MIRIWRLFHRSLLLRTAAVLLGSLFITASFVNTLLQTSLVFRVFPGVMDHHAIATSELVFLLESVPEDAAPVVLSAYSSASRAAYVREDFPAQAKPSAAMSQPFQSLPANAAYDLSGRETRFRTIRGVDLALSKSQLGDTTLVGMSALEVSIQLEDQRVLSVLLTPPAIIGYYGLPLFGLFVLTIAAASLLSLYFLFQIGRASCRERV